MSKTYTKKQVRRIKEDLEYGNLNGALCTDLEVGSHGPESDMFYPEDNPTRFKAEAEKTYSRQKSNSYIVLGKDRMGDIYSGFGGRGAPNSNAIDLVAGMASSFETPDKTYLTKDNVVDPNPFTDAARVYISQRTDLDGHFGITEGKIYPLDSQEGVSGVAMKADSVLVLGRRNIKIKAGQSHGEGLPDGGETDAHGTRLPDARIEFIADGPLEPMVKGQKLVDCIKGIYAQIRENKAAIIALTAQLTTLHGALLAHTHVGNLGVPTLPSPQLINVGIKQISTNLVDIQEAVTDSLNDVIEELNCVDIQNKDKYILSKSVFTS